MKRSQINRLQQEAIRFLDKHHLRLPKWAYYRPRDWRRLTRTAQGRRDLAQIKKYKMGWDLTDFGQGNFRRFGLILFTIRNGDPEGRGKPYCEKVMITRQGQMNPIHYHFQKMEDIINRGGGNLIVQVWNSTQANRLSQRPALVKVDGITKRVSPGGKIRLRPGESVCLPQRLFHRFYAEKDTGDVLIGEVSMTNDDDRDNLFFDPIGPRFPIIDEDQEILYPLCFEYP
jgi:D-lyxose ketol-isomerase